MKIIIRPKIAFRMKDDNGNVLSENKYNYKGFSN